ncbi:MAG TPA: hypothetical protein VHQ22_03235 [Terriglobales bacterium]|nr:hypothetical protein [Terriglobales bacterium]
MKINDGLVLAADSASTIMGVVPAGQSFAVNIYNNANKIFNLRKGSPIGAMTWGSGSIGTASISTLAKDLRRRFSGDDPKFESWEINPSGYQVQDVAKRLREFMYDENYVPSMKEFEHSDKKPDMGFIVAGYSPGAQMAEEYRLDILADGSCVGPIPIHALHETGLSWVGMAEPISRLVLGFSPLLGDILQKSLGVPDEQIQPALSAIKAVLQQNGTLVHPAMPLQDAIDLAEYLVHTAIEYYRFAPGAPGVGGPIEIAAISKHEGFKWVKRKYYFSRDLNPDDGLVVVPKK